MSRSALVLAVSIFVLASAVARAESRVTGQVTVDGKTVAVVHGVAVETTQGGDDPITFVRLTEKPLGKGIKEDGVAFAGNAGAVFAVHLHKSGKLYQALGLHPSADPRFPTDIPVASVKVTQFKIGNGEIAATLENVGEVKVDGHVWAFRFEFRLPIESY